MGDGVYKSTDGGENWNNVGLKDSERISKILIDPKDGNTVYACATGHLWDDSQERGVYKRDYRPGTLREKLFAGSPLLPPSHPAAAHRRPPGNGQ